jgi:general secretion pathway protein A
MVLIFMYLSHYQLNKEPFSISPDPQFLWLSEKHQRAFETLKEGILERDGCVMLAGDIGTGKTTLIKRLVKLDDVAAIFVTINDPDLNALDFFNMLASEFQMGRQFAGKDEFIASFKHFLLNAFSSYKKVLIIIDEAQRLNPEILQEIVGLSHLQMAGRKLLKVFFVGQLEFNAMLMRAENRDVLQDITAHYYLEPLSEQETKLYIVHRLKMAGARRQMFTSEAVKEIFSLSKGYPRLINVICDSALRNGYNAGLSRIDAKVIQQCRQDFPVESGPDEGLEKENLVAGVEATIEARQHQIAEAAPQTYRGFIMLAAAIVIVGLVLWVLLW